mgnify:CR=1 FL=1
MTLSEREHAKAVADYLKNRPRALQVSSDLTLSKHLFHMLRIPYHHPLQDEYLVTLQPDLLEKAFASARRQQTMDH